MNTEARERQTEKRLLEQLRNRSAKVIQQHYKEMQKYRRAQHHGLNNLAIPFKPKKIDPLLKLLPPDDQVVNPWLYQSY